MSIVFTGPDNMSEPITSIKMYSDSTPMVKTGGWSRIVNRADTVTVRASSLNEFVTAMFLVDAVNNSRGRIEHLVLPYIPGARQDRINPTGDVLFTLASVGMMINQYNFRTVKVLDPHSPVADEIINSMVEYPLSKIAYEIDTHYDGVIAADKGGKDRAFEFYCELRHRPDDFVTASKTRDVSTGKLTGFEVDVKPGHHYLVADDICDGGGTFIGLGEKIAEQGATADLYVSHGIFAKGTDALKVYYNTIYTTDSFPSVRDDNDVTIIPVVKKMEKYNG